MFLYIYFYIFITYIFIISNFSHYFCITNVTYSILYIQRQYPELNLNPETIYGDIHMAYDLIFP